MRTTMAEQYQQQKEKELASLRLKWAESKKFRVAAAAQIVATHGFNIQVLMSEIVSLVDYYRVHRARTSWNKVWSNDGTTCMDKLFKSLERNASQLPLENPEQFARDVSAYIQSSWIEVVSTKKRGRKRKKLTTTR